MSQSIYLSSFSSDQGVEINSENQQSVSGVAGNVNMNGNSLKESIFMFSSLYSGSEFVILNGQTNMPALFNIEDPGAYGYSLSLTPPSGESLPRACSINTISSINGGEYGGFMVGTYGTAEIGAYIKYGAQNMTSGAFNPDVSISTPSNSNKCVAVSAAGDLDNNNKIDYLFGVPGSNKAFVAYSPLASYVTLTSLGTAGVTITGASLSKTGISVANIGNFLGSGNATIFVGATGANNNYGGGYLLWGPNLPSSISTSSLGSYAITVVGNAQYMNCGAVSTYVGDVNKDEKEDLLFSCTGSGNIILVLGTNTPSTTINTASLGSAGVIFIGIPSGQCGDSLGGGIDFNGDRINDIVIGCPNANNGIGLTVIIWGSPNFPSTISLGDIGNYGMYVYGGTSAATGLYVSGAGNVTGSLYDAINIATPYFEDTGTNITAYLLFGEEAQVAANPTATPTSAPVITTNVPSKAPTLSPVGPTADPTKSPTVSPVSTTNIPTKSPTNSPVGPTADPTKSPTASPNVTPTQAPSSPSDTSGNGQDGSSSEEQTIGISVGSVFGGLVLFLGIGYCIYAKMKHLWPFLDVVDNAVMQDGMGMTGVTTNPVIDKVVEDA